MTANENDDPIAIGDVHMISESIEDDLDLNDYENNKSQKLTEQEDGLTGQDECVRIADEKSANGSDLEKVGLGESSLFKSDSHESVRITKESHMKEAIKGDAETAYDSDSPTISGCFPSVISDYKDNRSSVRTNGTRHLSLASQLYDQVHEGDNKDNNDTGYHNTFNSIKNGMQNNNNNNMQAVNEIDWEFWSRVVNNYSEFLKDENNLRELTEKLKNGIPIEIRGLVWQIISGSGKNFELKETFLRLKKSNGPYDKSIRRDLVRTSFINDNKDKIEDLFEIIKVYSLYDHEVGYTQGMAFITLPLLINMNADESFCLLVKLMMKYQFRDFYMSDMPGLSLRIYQFDRLLEDRLPELYEHLKNENIKSSMYTVQWFLTVFAYKFPLKFVMRIFDIIIFEGIESILKFSINLMEVNKDFLMNLEFDHLLKYLKESLFLYYKISEEEDSYDINKFINDSMNIEILPITLEKYTREFNEIDKVEKTMARHINDLEIENGNITQKIRVIESSYALLNKEQITVLKDMVDGKIEIERLQEEKAELSDDILNLKARIERLGKEDETKDDFTGVLSDSIDSEIQKVLEENAAVMNENQELEEELERIEAEKKNWDMTKQEQQTGGKIKKKLFNSKFW